MLFFADSMLYLQHACFPARFRNSRGKARLLGRVNQIAKFNNRHVSSCTNTKFDKPKQRKSPRNLDNSVPKTVMMMRKAFFFNWSHPSLSLPTSPGPGPIRMRRTVRLQYDTMSIENPKRQRNGTVGKNGEYHTPKPGHPKQSSQTHPVLMFLILTAPLSLWRR